MILIVYFAIWLVTSLRLYSISHNEFVFAVALLWPIFLLLIIAMWVMKVHYVIKDYFNKL